MEVDERLGAAVQAGDLAAIRSALANGANPNTLVARFCPTALAAAARRGHLSAMVALLGAGADPNLADRSDVTPLRSAILAGEAAAVLLLLDSGASLARRSGTHPSPLLEAIGTTEYRPGPGSLNVLRLLLERGACEADEEEHRLIDAVTSDRPPATLRLLLQFNADPNARRSDGAPAIVVAARRANAGIVDALIVAGADVDATDAGGRTALMHATERDDLRSIAVLLAAGADPNCRAADGSQALDLARAWNRQNAIHRLGEPTADGTYAPFRRTTMEAVPTSVQLRGDAACFEQCRVVATHVLDQLGEEEFTTIAGYRGTDPHAVVARLAEAAASANSPGELVRLDLSMPEWQVVRGALLMAAGGGPVRKPVPGLTSTELRDLCEDLYRRP